LKRKSENNRLTPSPILFDFLHAHRVSAVQSPSPASQESRRPFVFFTCRSRATRTYMAFVPARIGSAKIKSAKQVFGWIHALGRIVNKSRPGPKSQIMERPLRRSLPWRQRLHLSHPTCQLLYADPKPDPSLRSPRRLCTSLP